MKACGRKLLLTIFILLAGGFIIYHQKKTSSPVSTTLNWHPAVPEYSGLMVPSILLMIAFGVRMFLKNLKLVVTTGAIMIIIGFLWGIVMYHNEVIRLAMNVVHLSPYKIVCIFIPTVLFNLSFSVDNALFFKTLTQSAVIGIPVCLLTAIIFGGMTKFVINSSWTIGSGLWFGMFALPTYPKIITNLLKQQCFRTRQIGVLLDAEAIFTFTVVNVMYTYYYASSSGYIAYWYQYVCVFIRFVMLGILLGYFFGLLGRYMLRKMCNNKLSIFVVICTLPYITYNFSNVYMSCCGEISVTVLGLMLSVERTILAKDVEEHLLKLLGCMIFSLNIFICSIYAMTTACYVTPFMTYSDYALLLGTYLLYMCVRFMSFLVFSPLLSRLGYGMDFRSMLICVWGGLKSSYCVLIISFLNEAQFENERDIAKFYIIGLYMFSNLINGGSIMKVLEFLELNKMSIARQLNMLHCMRHIHIKRNKAITWLKYDRFLCDLNWNLIKKMTNMRNPYLNQMDEDEIENLSKPEYHFTYCSDCLREVPLEPTPKEFKEMIREAKLKVLKAKKMSYSRQYENGMISNEGIRILSQAVEMAMDSEETEIKVEDLYKRFVEEKWYQRLARLRLELFHKNQARLRPPRTYWRRICYHIVLKPSFDKIMMIIVALHCCLLALDYYLHPFVLFPEKYKHSVYLDYFLTIMKTIFATIYTTEFIIKILALSWRTIICDGCGSYFKGFWNIQDFIFMITSWCSVERSIYDFNLETSKHSDLSQSIYSKFVEICEFLRAVRLLRIFTTFYENFLELIVKIDESRMAFTYELGKSYATGEQEVLEMLPNIISNSKIRENVRKQMEKDRVILTKLLGMVQKERPWIAITVKTRQVIRTILNGMNETVLTLKSNGWVDTHEFELLMDSLNQVEKKVNMIKKVQPSAPKIIFKEISWMANDEEVIDFLFENVTARSFEPGEIIFDEGHVANVIYIVVTGLFLITYTPNPYILRSYKEYGFLPIVDHHFGSNYDKPCVDYIVSGNCIGEHSILTLRPFNCTIKADTHSQVYVLSYGVLRRAMQLSPDPVFGLESRIWKEVGVRIAIPVLMSNPAYQSYSQDQIKSVLERAFVPDLSTYKIFIVTEYIEDVVVIEGLIADLNTNTKYIAPCCVPRTVQNLILPNNSLLNVAIDIITKLLIIPVKGVDERDIVAAADETSELGNKHSSQKCLQHTIQGRTQRRRLQRLRQKYSELSYESTSHSIEKESSLKNGKFEGASTSGSGFVCADEYDSVESLQKENKKKFTSQRMLFFTKDFN